MSKKILFCCLFILIFLIPSKPDPNAKTWERHNTTVSADSILAAIDRGDSIIIDRCKIFGPLKKEGTWERPDTILSFIKISNSVFHDPLSFAHCHFQKNCLVPRTTFDARVYFGKVTLSGKVIFEHCSFNGYTFFWATRFDSALVFSYATFNSSAGFFEDHFVGNANFDHTEFVRDAQFGGTGFCGRANFRLAKFRQNAIFDSCTFRGNITFEKASFSGEANFLRTSFKGDANFMGATFDGRLDLWQSIFEADVDLSFREFQNIFVSWRQLDDHLVYYENAKLIYYKMMKYFDEHRQLENSDGVYLFLKDGERKAKPFCVRYLEYCLIQLTCGYGVKPWRPLATSLIIIGLFFVAYCVIDIKEKDLSPRILGLNGVIWSLYNGLYYSINTFIAGAPVNWCPKDESKTRFYLFRILTTIERTLGWILLVLFVVTLTRKFIR